MEVFSSLVTVVVVSEVEDFLDDLENPDAQLPRELITERPPARSVEALLVFFEAKSLLPESLCGSNAWLGLLEMSPAASGAEISMLDGLADFSSNGVDADDDKKALNLALSANIFQSSPLLLRTK